MKDHSVSVIIINYNGQQYLDNLLLSLQNQSFSNFEIIIVDNASKDNSLIVIQKYLKTLPIKLLNNEKNLGFCLANNQALELATGKYVVFLNNDTMLDSCWLETLVRRAETYEKDCIIVSSIHQMTNCGTKEGPEQYDVYGATGAVCESNFFYGTGASLFTSKKLLNEIGCFDPQLFMYQDDVDLCWRARLYGCDLLYEPKSICYHLKSSTNFLIDNLKMPLWKFFHAHCKNRIRLLLKHYSKENIIRKLPICIILIMFRSIVLTFFNKTPKYISCFIKGLFWNLINFPDTLSTRHAVQKLRRVKDDEILLYMIPCSIEILSIKKLKFLIDKYFF